MLTLLIIGFSSIVGLVIYFSNNEKKNIKILNEINLNKSVMEKDLKSLKSSKLTVSKNKNYERSKTSIPNCSTPENNVQSTIYEPIIIYDDPVNIENVFHHHKNLDNSNYNHANNHSHDYSSYNHANDCSSDNYSSSDYSSGDCSSGGSDFGGSID